jgi:hypothetical protein
MRMAEKLDWKGLNYCTFVLGAYVSTLHLVRLMKGVQVLRVDIVCTYDPFSKERPRVGLRCALRVLIIEMELFSN